MLPIEPTLYERLGGRRALGVLVRNFYLALQVHPTLGPIFAAHVADWPRHYATLTEFWSLQTGGPSEYSASSSAPTMRSDCGRSSSKGGWRSGGRVADCTSRKARPAR